MNYYERHLGDYARDTAHLTMVEHGAYNLLLDRYYATEQGIPADQVHRLARARSRDERAAVDAVLQEFFRLEDGVWLHKRAEQEIVKAQGRIQAAQANGRRGGRPKKTQQEPTGLLLGSISETQLKAHQTPDTKHQYPIAPKPKKPDRGGVHEFPPGFDRFWAAYPRKTAKPQALQAYTRLRVDDELLERLLAALSRQRECEQWRREGGRFVPHPATWLNQRRWEDEVASESIDDDLRMAV